MELFDKPKRVGFTCDRSIAHGIDEDEVIAYDAEASTTEALGRIRTSSDSTEDKTFLPDVYAVQKSAGNKGVLALASANAVSFGKRLALADAPKAKDLVPCSATATPNRLESRGFR